MTNGDVNIAEFINRTTASTIGDSITVTIPGMFRPEMHPDYVRARENGSFCGIVMCRHCGNDSEADGFGARVREVMVGYDIGVPRAQRDGTVEYDHDYVEDGELESREVIEYECHSCGKAEGDFDALVIAVPDMSEAEEDAGVDYDEGAFYQSVIQKKLVVFDATAWEAENADRLRIEAQQQRNALEAQKARIETQLANLPGNDDISF